MRSVWQSWLKRSGEEVAPLLGLSLAGLYLLAVAGIGAIALQVQRTEVAAQHLADSKPFAYWFAQHLATAASPEQIGRELRDAGRDETLSFCAIVDSAGKFVAHCDPTKAKRPAPKITWTGGEDQSVRVGVLPGTDHVVVAARIPSAGTSKGDSLWVGLSSPRPVWSNSRILFWSGYILLGTLGLYLLLYRLLRRAVRPLAVIGRRLIGGDGPISERLAALRLNDSYDEISHSWNQLIDFVDGLQEQLRRDRLVNDVGTAMDAYRSERLTAILMQIPFGVLVIDAGSNITFANRAATGMLGADGQSIEEKPAREVLDESLCLTLLSAGGKHAAPGAGRWTDYMFKRPHGDATLRFWAVPSESGEETILFAQDVTQAKEAERARDQFLYHITHELRTPLTNIRAYAETLSQGVIEDQQTVRDCYNVIMGETQRLNRLVEDILSVSQLEVGSARLDIGDVHIDRLLRSVVQDTQCQADSKNIDLVLSLPPKIPQLRGDKDRLAVVLTNLVGNAIKYTPAGGRVDVRCHAENGRIRILVVDTGIGIKPEEQEKIFEKFYRVNDEHVAAIPGTGLGLAIVKETVRLHGGAVFVESTFGQGSTFTLTLPAVAMEETPAAQ
jgi:signal transduction histidine kinase